MSTGDSTLESSTSGRHSTNLVKFRYLNQVSAVQCNLIFSCTWDFVMRSAIRLQKIVVQLLKPSLIMLSKFSIQNSNASLWYLLLKHPGLSIAWILLHSVFAFLFYFHFAVARMTYDLYLIHGSAEGCRVTSWLFSITFSFLINTSLSINDALDVFCTEILKYPMYKRGQSALFSIHLTHL